MSLNIIFKDCSVVEVELQSCKESNNYYIEPPTVVMDIYNVWLDIELSQH